MKASVVVLVLVVVVVVVEVVVVVVVVGWLVIVEGEMDCVIFVICNT